MKKIFNIELKRAIVNSRFFLALIIGIILCYYGLTDYFMFKPESFPKNVVNAYRGWFTALGQGTRSFFLYAVVIIATVPFSYSYIEDKNSGYLKNILYRIEYKKYFKSKLLANSIAGGLALFIPVVVLFIICSIKYPVAIFIIPGTSSVEGFYPDGIFASQYAFHPFNYILYNFINVFVVGFIYSLFGMAVSMFTNKKISAVLIPSIIYIAINMFTDFIEKDQYSSFASVFPWITSETTLLSVYGSLILIFFISIIIIKLMHGKDIYY